MKYVCTGTVQPFRYPDNSMKGKTRPKSADSWTVHGTRTDILPRSAGVKTSSTRTGQSLTTASGWGAGGIGGGGGGGGGVVKKKPQIRNYNLKDSGTSDR